MSKRKARLRPSGTLRCNQELSGALRRAAEGSSIYLPVALHVAIESFPERSGAFQVRSRALWSVPGAFQERCGAFQERSGAFRRSRSRLGFKVGSRSVQGRPKVGARPDKVVSKIGPDRPKIGPTAAKVGARSDQGQPRSAQGRPKVGRLPTKGDHFHGQSGWCGWFGRAGRVCCDAVLVVAWLGLAWFDAVLVLVW